MIHCSEECDTRVNELLPPEMAACYSAIPDWMDGLESLVEFLEKDLLPINYNKSNIRIGGVADPRGRQVLVNRFYQFN